MSFPDVPDFLILHLIQNTGDYLEIRKTGMERSIFLFFPDVPDFLIHFSFKVLGFELGEGDSERF